NSHPEDRSTCDLGGSIRLEWAMRRRFSSPEVLHQHQIAAMILVLREQKRSLVGGHRKAERGFTSEGGDHCHFVRDKIQKLDGRWRSFGDKVDPVIAESKVATPNLIHNLNLFAAAHGYSP